MMGFSHLTTREKRLLTGGAVLVTVLGVWFYGWQPIAAQRGEQQDRIARYLSLMDIAQAAPRATPPTDNICQQSTALGPRVTQSAESVGIPLARLDPEGPRLRITVADTTYGTAVAWISQLETRDCVRAAAVEMSRLTAPGRVSLRMTLEDAGT